jgi:hypothetical protein
MHGRGRKMRMAGAKPPAIFERSNWLSCSDQFLMVMQEMSERFRVRQTASA